MVLTLADAAGALHAHAVIWPEWTVTVDVHLQYNEQVIELRTSHP